MGLTLIAFTEITAVMFVYGHKRFIKDIYEMTGVALSPYWPAMWVVVAPILMASILVASIVFQLINPATYSTWNAEKVEIY